MPGQELRSRYDDAFVDVMTWVTVAMFLPGMCGALYAGMLQRPGGVGTLTTVFYIASASFVIALAAYKLVKIHRRAMNIRLGLDAELAAGQELDQLMRDGAYVFHDLPAGKFNIDHVLICEAGVFAVETKARVKPDRGRGSEDAKVFYDGTTLRFPTFEETAPIEQARRNADWLQKELTSSVGEPIAVKGVVALPGWWVGETGRPQVRVLNAKNLKFLLEVKGQSLSHTLMKRIAHQIEQRCRNIDPAYSGSMQTATS